MSDVSAWLLSIGAFVGIVFCAVVAAKSIAGDPPRGRRRCPRCWHELGPAEGATSMQCAECGHVARDEADLSRNRRSVSRAIVAILGVVAIGIATRVRMLDRGPWSMVPSNVLLSVTPILDDGGYRSAAWELANRVRTGDATDAQAREAFALFIEGDADARPPSLAWRAKYRDLGSATMARLGSDDPLLRRLLEIPPAFEIAWSAGGVSSPPLLSLDADVWWPDGHEGKLELTFADGSKRLADFRPDGRFPALIVELPEGGRTGSVTLELSARPLGITDAERGWTTYPKTVAEIPQLTATADRGWTPVDRPDLRDTIRTVFDEGLAVWASGAPRAGLRFDSRLTAGEDFAGTAIGLRVEVLEDGVVRRTSRIWWMGGSRSTNARWLPSIEDAEAMARLFEGNPETDRSWSLRITGDQGLARYAAPASGEPSATQTGAEAAVRAWFSGVIETPLRIERGNMPAPVRRWKVRDVQHAAPR